MANVREYVQNALKEFVAQNPPVPGGGRRTLIVPEPQPEDARERYKAEGEVPEGFMRAEICRPNRMEGEKLYRLGSFWATVKHHGKSPVLERVFTGDVVDIPDDEFAKFYAKNWVRQPWQPKEKTKPQAA